MNNTELNELQIRLQRIKSEPNGIVRETMIDNFLIDMDGIQPIKNEQDRTVKPYLFDDMAQHNTKDQGKYVSLVDLQEFIFNTCNVEDNTIFIDFHNYLQFLARQRSLDRHTLSDEATFLQFTLVNAIKFGDDAMEHLFVSLGERLGKFKPLSPEDIERAAKGFRKEHLFSTSFTADVRSFTEGANFAKQPIANTKTLTDDEIEDVIERFKDDTSSSVFATHTFYKLA